VIDIDPRLVDTSQWTGWYNYWTYVLVSNADKRVPTQAYDFDSNGFPEVYGLDGGIGFPSQHRIYEVYPDGTSLHRYTYPIAGLSTQVLDVDRNGLMDIAFNWGQYTYVYEQPTPTSLPTQLKCAFNKYNPNAAYVSIEHLAYMDADSLIDFVHRGTDSTVSPNYLHYVSEYNASTQCFQKTWFIELPMANDWWDGYNVGDYDGDGKMEFLASSLWGKVRAIENTGDDTYAVTFEDSLPLVNMFHQTSGDIDRDGKREFFVGATMGSGNWTVMYEADSPSAKRTRSRPPGTDNDHYSPRIVLHLLSGGSLDNPTYFCRDVNNDGELELVILSGGWLYVFKSDADDSYYLWYLKRGPSSFTVNFHDMDGDGIQDILWSSIRESRWATDIFRGSPLVGVGPEPPPLPQQAKLSQNHPNPFNPRTVIEYQLPIDAHVVLKVYDLLGRVVATVVDEQKPAGYHRATFDAAAVGSGVYFYRMAAGNYTAVRKMVVVK